MHGQVQPLVRPSRRCPAAAPTPPSVEPEEPRAADEHGPTEGADAELGRALYLERPSQRTYVDRCRSTVPEARSLENDATPTNTGSRGGTDAQRSTASESEPALAARASAAA